MRNILVLLFTIGIAAYAGAIREGTLRASSDGNNITVQWGSLDESSIKTYEVERRSGTTGEFVYLASVQKKGSNSYYQYVDKTAFKTTSNVYYYRIKIVFNDNSFEYSTEINVPHNVSSVKRTWGSLKAMFR